MQAKRYAIIALAIVLVAVGFALSTYSQKSAPEIQASSVNVSFITEDGVKISGELFFPASSKNVYPAVILVHQFGGNRHQWDAFIPNLLGMGYAVLAYDIRGFGESTTMIVNGQEVPFQRSPTYLDDMVKDVSAALKVLTEQPRIDHNRIAIIGASVGANIAFVSSGAFPQIRTAVSLSPTNTGGPLMGRNVRNFSPKNIFFLSDELEEADAMALYELSTQAKQVQVYSGGGHGISLLSKSNAVQDIFLWLRNNLG